MIMIDNALGMAAMKLFLLRLRSSRSGRVTAKFKVWRLFNSPSPSGNVSRALHFSKLRVVRLRNCPNPSERRELY